MDLQKGIATIVVLGATFQTGLAAQALPGTTALQRCLESARENGELHIDMCRELMLQELPMPVRPTEMTDSVVEPRLPLERIVRFIERGLNRLSEKGTYPADRFTQAIRRDSSTRDLVEAEYVEVAQSITQRATIENVTSEVQFEFSGKDIQVVFETISERHRGVTPTKVRCDLGRCRITVPIGMYFVWAERDTKDLSDRDELFEVVDREMRVFLVASRVEHLDSIDAVILRLKSQDHPQLGCCR